MTPRRHRTSRREIRALLLVAGLRPVPGSSRFDVPVEHTSQGTDEVALPSRRDLRRLLRVAATRPVPPLAPASIAACAPSLLTSANTVVLRTQRRHDRRNRAPAVLTGAVAAAATLVLAGALTGVVGGSDAATDLVLGVAVDTIVVLPDGSSVDGSSGLALPDGAVVRTGPRGRAAAGGVELGPGLQAIVDAGELTTDTVQAAPAEPVTPEAGATTTEAAVVDDVGAPASEEPDAAAPAKPDAAAPTRSEAGTGRRPELPAGSPSGSTARAYPRSEVAAGH